MKAMEQQSTVGRTIRWLRKDKDLTVDALIAQASLDVSKTYISMIENDDRLPSPRIVILLERYFKLRPYTLVKMVEQQAKAAYEKKMDKKYKICTNNT